MKPLFLFIGLFYSFVLFGQNNAGSAYFQARLDSGIAQIDSGNYEDAVFAFRKVLASNSREVPQQLLSMANYHLGYCYDRLNKPDSSLKYVSLAIPYFTEKKDTLMLAKSYYLLSYEQLILGSYDISLENNQKALQSYSALQDTLGIIRSLIWTSLIYHDSRQYDLGIEYGEKALNLIRKTNMPNANQEQRALNSIAISYDDRGDYDLAIAHHKKVFDLKDRLSDTLRLGPTYNNIGNSLMKKGDYKSAYLYFLRNLKISKIRKSQYNLATVYTNLGTVSFKENRYTQAKAYLDSAEYIAYEIMDTEKIQDVLYQQYAYNKQIGELSNAIGYLNSFYELKDSLLNIDKVNALNELETRYKTREKESEIAQKTKTIETQKVLLRQNLLINIGLGVLVALLILIGLLYRNRLKKKQQLALQQKEIEFKEAQLNAIIDTQEKERARFATDLHDSFGQTISILKMNIGAAQEVSKNKTADNLFNESTIMLNEMYDELRGVCFNLMPSTLIQLGLVDAVMEFAKRVNASGQVKIEVNNFGLENRLEELHEISLYRIVQEWVNNILKYGNASSVNIQFTTDENELTLTIEDNGPGFDKNQLKLSKGNGWKNINSRARLLKGTVEVDSTLGVIGSILIVNIPLQNNASKG